MALPNPFQMINDHRSLSEKSFTKFLMLAYNLQFPQVSRGCSLVVKALEGQEKRQCLTLALSYWDVGVAGVEITRGPRAQHP